MPTLGALAKRGPSLIPTAGILLGPDTPVIECCTPCRHALALSDLATSLSSASHTQDPIETLHPKENPSSKPSWKCLSVV